MPSLLTAASTPELSASLGTYDPTEESTGEVGLELRATPRRFNWQPNWLPDLEPTAGLIVTSRNSSYLYGGFSTRLSLSPAWEIRPTLAAGRYWEGEGKNLGGALEFRSAIGVLYQMRPETWIGLTLYHLSNAGLYDNNPGSESVTLTVLSRLGRRF
jgi:lipid A 3-O-deacylase